MAAALYPALRAALAHTEEALGLDQCGDPGPAVGAVQSPWARGQEWQASLLPHQVPIHGEAWDERRLGFLEADTVAHCGGGLAGNLIWSLTYTDLASTWTEGRKWVGS